MATTLNKAKWTVTTNAAPASAADPSPESIGGVSLLTPLDVATSFYAYGDLPTLKTIGGTVSFWNKFIRGGAMTGDANYFFRVKELGIYGGYKGGYKFNVKDIPATLDYLTLPAYHYNPVETVSAVATLLDVTLTADNTDVYGYRLQTSQFTDTTWHKHRITYYDDTDFPKVIVERYNGTRWVLALELLDKAARTVSSYGLYGAIGFGVDGDSGGNEAAAEVGVSAIRLSNEWDDGLSRTADTEIRGQISATDSGDIIVNKPTSITQTITQVTGPDGTVNTNALTFANASGSAQVVELFIPAIAYKNATLEVYYQMSAYSNKVSFNMRRANADDQEFYYINSSVDGVGATLYDLGRVEDSATSPGTNALIPLITDLSGSNSANNVWIGYKASVYDSTTPRVKLERVNATTPAMYGNYSTIFDKIDTITGYTSEPADLLDKLGLYSVIFEIPNGATLTVAEVNLYEI